MVLSEAYGYIRGVDFQHETGFRLNLSLRPFHYAFNEMSKADVPVNRKVLIGKHLEDFEGRKVKVTVELLDK